MTMREIKEQWRTEGLLCECGARQREGSEQCWDCHVGQPVWSEHLEVWQPARQLEWGSLLSNRKLVLL